VQLFESPLVLTMRRGFLSSNVNSAAGMQAGSSSAPESTTSSSPQLKRKAEQLDDSEDSEIHCLSTSLFIAFLLSSQGPRTVPRGFVGDQTSKHVTFKLNLGDDETAFVLRKNDTLLHRALERLENLPLNVKRTMVTESFVEVKPSPMGGLGLFAVKDFAPGDLIISERPMVRALHFLLSRSVPFA
jgi:hypothetical protein